MRLLGLEGEVGQVRERKEVRREDGEGQEGRGHVEARAGEERSGGKAWKVQPKGKKGSLVWPDC